MAAEKDCQKNSSDRNNQKMSNKPKLNYKRLWEKLIYDICAELVKIDKLPQRTVEDEWVKTVLVSVLKKMCALHRLHPRLQNPMQLTRPLFEGKLPPTKGRRL